MLSKNLLKTFEKTLIVKGCNIIASAQPYGLLDSLKTGQAELKARLGVLVGSRRSIPYRKILYKMNIAKIDNKKPQESIPKLICKRFWPTYAL